MLKCILFVCFRSLVKINLSYNHISDITGFKSLHGPQFKLSQIELHGNQLSSLQHVIKALIGCSNLRQLTLSIDGSSNPLCSEHGKYSLGYRYFPQVESVTVLISFLHFDVLGFILTGLRSCFITCLILMKMLFLLTDQYRSRLLSALAQLEALDGLNRHGNPVHCSDVLADIPGIL